MCHNCGMFLRLLRTVSDMVILSRHCLRIYSPVVPYLLVLKNPVVPVFILSLIEAAASLWVLLNESSTPYGLGIVYYISVFNPGNYATSSGGVISSSSTKPKYCTNSSFSQSNGSLFLLSNYISITLCSNFVLK